MIFMNTDRIPVIGAPAIAIGEWGLKTLRSIEQALYYLFISSVREKSVEEKPNFHGITQSASILVEDFFANRWKFFSAALFS